MRIACRLSLMLTWACLLSVQGPASAQDADAAKKKATQADDNKPISAEELAKKAMKSIVVVQFAGRDGRDKGLGTGFVIDANGLVATNLHVIGEARPITVTAGAAERLNENRLQAGRADSGQPQRGLSAQCAQMCIRPLSSGVFFPYRRPNR